MIVRISSGIPGFDNITASDENFGLIKGGIPENSVSLVYGPPKVGKSVFCCQFAYQGLIQDEPYLYITTNGISDLKKYKESLGIDFNNFPKEMLYVIEAATSPPSGLDDESYLYQFSSINNPTDILFKITKGIQHIQTINPRFRAVLDTLTALIGYNSPQLIVRVLKNYILRVKAAGGTSLICYTQGSADERTEIMIKTMVDNIIRLNGEKIVIEAMKGLAPIESTYKLTTSGIQIIP